MGSSYSTYKLPNISSAIFVNTENLQTCLAKATTSSADLQACITANVSSSVTQGKSPVTYFGAGESVIMTNGKTTITPAASLPTSNCSEKFNSDNDANDINNTNDTNIESKKIFCFNGTFTILIIFVLILLLIFVNINSKNTVIQKPLL